jgi:hypothetical protein
MASVSSRPERKLDRLSPRACDDDRQDVIQRQPPFRLPIRLAGDETTFSFSKTCLRPISGAHSSAVPTVSGKDKFFAELETLIAKARELQSHGFDEQEPEAATCNDLIRPFLDALGFRTQNIKPEFKILGDSVDYLLKSARPLMFVEAKSLLDCWGKNLFDKHREQVHRYIQNYRLSPEITAMEQPVKWILLTNFAQLHFIRVNEVTPSFSFKLDDLWKRREELWELLALENLEANRIDEIYDQHKRAGLDQMFLADLKRWRLLIANGFALRNPKRSLDEITLASQQLLDRFIFCLMLETQRLVEFNKLARTYSNYEVLYARADKTFGEVLRESLFVEIKNDFNTELFEQPLLCDELAIDNAVLSAVIGHEPLAPELAAQCGFESGQGELLAFRHLYRYDFSLMSSDVMGAVYERFLAHKLFQNGGRVVIEDTDELRKKEGIYYTPQYIVDYIVAHTLGEKIKPILAEAKTLLGYKNFKGAIAKIRELGEIKVLDPAMGSGSFLLRAFDALVKAYDDYNQECRRIKKERNGHGALFDADLVIAEEVLDAPQINVRGNRAVLQHFQKMLGLGFQHDDFAEGIKRLVLDGCQPAGLCLRLLELPPVKASIAIVSKHW